MELNNYVYYVPFVKAGDDLFLKTIVPSRKLTENVVRISILSWFVFRLLIQ